MITTTARSTDRNAMKRRGVTLVELMIAAALAGIILTGVMSSFLFLSRGTIASSDYVDMDREARVALEKFARDVRMASEVTSFTSDAVTLTVQDGAPRTVSYTHVPADRTFYRNYGTPNEEVLIQGVTEFTLRPFTLLQTIATNIPLETKLLQLDLTAERSGPARALATNNVISARFVMRNKIVAN